MKIKYILGIAGIAGVMLAACDKLEAPYATIEKIPPDPTKQRKVLLEDYTGHRCPNCPAAAIIAHTLAKLYNPRLIVIAVHAGFFADPAAFPFEADYRVPEGVQWFNDFNIGSNPMGMIDRKKNSTGTYAVSRDNWADSVAREMRTEQLAAITITSQLNSGRAANVNLGVSVKFKKALEGIYNLSVCILEDSITSAQVDPASPTGVDLNYVFMDMLRGVVNGAYGDLLTVKVDTAQTYTWNKPGYPLQPVWKPGHCSVVAFVFRSDTKEVIQAEKIPLTH